MASKKSKPKWSLYFSKHRDPEASLSAIATAVLLLDWYLEEGHKIFLSYCRKRNWVGNGSCCWLLIDRRQLSHHSNTKMTMLHEHLCVMAFKAMIMWCGSKSIVHEHLFFSYDLELGSIFLHLPVFFVWFSHRTTGLSTRPETFLGHFKTNKPASISLGPRRGLSEKYSFSISLRSQWGKIVIFQLREVVKWIRQKAGKMAPCVAAKQCVTKHLETYIKRLFPVGLFCAFFSLLCHLHTQRTINSTT